MKKLESTLIRNYLGELIELKSHNNEYVDLIKPEFFNDPGRKKIQEGAILHTINQIGEGPYEVLEIFEYLNEKKNKPYDLLTLRGKSDTTIHLDKRFFYKYSNHTVI